MLVKAGTGSTRPSAGAIQGDPAAVWDVAPTVGDCMATVVRWVNSMHLGLQ